MAMMAKKLPQRDNLTRGHQFDGGPFALDLYRLLGMVLSDKRISSLGDRTTYQMQPIWELQDRFRKAEILRILISSAVVLRILFDQKQDPRDRRFEIASKKPCGVLWSKLPSRKTEVLTLREACNKIIHATDVNEDEVNSDWKQNPDQLGVYIRPFVYLEGMKDSNEWRVKLSIVDFVLGGASVLVHYMPDRDSW
jgi:hypothetical protein